MKIRAEQKTTRQSPRKVRLVANQVKGLSLEQAFAKLALMERRASLVVIKVLRQAVANAVHNHQLQVEDLEIENILVKTGPTYRRWQPVSRGRAHKILKRTSHIEVILKTKGNEPTQPVAKTAQAAKSKKTTAKTDDKKPQKAQPKPQTKTEAKVKTKETVKQPAAPSTKIKPSNVVKQQHRQQAK